MWGLGVTTPIQSINSHSGSVKGWEWISLNNIPLDKSSLGAQSQFKGNKTLLVSVSQQMPTRIPRNKIAKRKEQLCWKNKLFKTFQRLKKRAKTF